MKLNNLLSIITKITLLIISLSIDLILANFLFDLIDIPLTIILFISLLGFLIRNDIEQLKKQIPFFEFINNDENENK